MLIIEKKEIITEKIPINVKLNLLIESIKKNLFEKYFLLLTIDLFLLKKQLYLFF